jgi:hypothetical protein
MTGAFAESVMRRRSFAGLQAEWKNPMARPDKPMPQIEQSPCSGVAILSTHSGEFLTMDEYRPRRPGRAARAVATRSGPRAAARAAASVPYITRKIPYYEVLSEEGLELLERNADTILEEVGIEFREDAEALALWKQAGADVQGERVRMPRGLARSLIQNHAPREFVQHARNPARSVAIGGKNTVFAPAYGSPSCATSMRAALRAHRRLSQFRQARLRFERAAPLGRHDLRARRPAGQQASLRDGVQPYQVQRQAVHGLGDSSGARPGFR